MREVSEWNKERWDEEAKLRVQPAKSRDFATSSPRVEVAKSLSLSYLAKHRT